MMILLHLLTLFTASVEQKDVTSKAEETDSTQKIAQLTSQMDFKDANCRFVLNSENNTEVFINLSDLLDSSKFFTKEDSEGYRLQKAAHEDLVQKSAIFLNSLRDFFQCTVYYDLLKVQENADEDVDENALISHTSDRFSEINLESKNSISLFESLYRDFVNKSEQKAKNLATFLQRSDLLKETEVKSVNSFFSNILASCRSYSQIQLKNCCEKVRADATEIYNKSLEASQQVAEINDQDELKTSISTILTQISSTAMHLQDISPNTIETAEEEKKAFITQFAAHCRSIITNKTAPFKIFSRSSRNSSETVDEKKDQPKGEFLGARNTTNFANRLKFFEEKKNEKKEEKIEFKVEVKTEEQAEVETNDNSEEKSTE